LTPINGLSSAIDLTVNNGSLGLADQEGGEIPIAVNRPGEDLSARWPSTSSVAAVNAAETGLAKQFMKSDNSANTRPPLQGETARAIVFAMSGGEPREIAHVSAVQRPAPAARPPVDHRATNASFSGQVDAAPSVANVSTAESKSTEYTKNSHSTMSEDRWTNWRYSQAKNSFAGNSVLAATVQSTRGVSIADSAVTTMGMPSSMAESFRDEAFAESDFAVANIGETAWSGVLPKTLAVTPLLIVWALERIAASNPRRAAQNSLPAERGDTRTWFQPYSG
jgi:hypothetical protein